MAEEGSEASVASSSPNPNWWDISLYNPNLSFSWSSLSRWPAAAGAPPLNHHNHRSSNSSCDSVVSIDSPSAAIDLPGSAVATENQLWNQVLLSLNHHQSHDGEIFTNQPFDYTKKMAGSGDYWPENLNSGDLEKHNLSFFVGSGGGGGGGGIMEQSRLSDLVSNWSIAPPNPSVQLEIRNLGFDPTDDEDEAAALNSAAAGVKHVFSPSSPSTYFQYLHESIRPESHSAKLARDEQDLNINDGSVLGYRPVDHLHHLSATTSTTSSWPPPPPPPPCLSSDVISFKPVELRASNLSQYHDHYHSKKLGSSDSSSSARGSGRSSSGDESAGKKKRSEEVNDSMQKKSKHDLSSSSSLLKLQVPKPKISERVAALQQIVAPFGKTDTASVLMDAIKCIRFLQEQIQLLSDPYMKFSANKDFNSWGVMEKKKDKGGDQATKNSVNDLKSRKLCLFPISCLPPSYRDNTGADYWTPTYRGCLYR